MNTTELIRHWTMQGAAQDVGARFGSVNDVLTSADGEHEPANETPAELHVRRSDEDEWEPLLLAAGEK